MKVRAFLFVLACLILYLNLPSAWKDYEVTKLDMSPPKKVATYYPSGRSLYSHEDLEYSPLIFADSGGYLWRSDNSTVVFQQTVRKLHQQTWLFAGEFLILIGPDGFEIFDELNELSHDTASIWSVSESMDDDDKFFSFAITENTEGVFKVVWKLVAWSGKYQEFTIWNLFSSEFQTSSSGSGELLSIMPLSINIDIHKKSLWGFAASFSNGRVELHSYTPDGKFLPSKIILQMEDIVPEDNLVFSQGLFDESLLFVSTGSKVRYCNLYSIVMDFKGDCLWVDIPLPSDVQVYSMILTLDESFRGEESEESLLIAYYVRNDKKLRLGSFRLISKILDLENFEDIQADDIDEFFFIKHDLVVQNRSNYLEGVNRYSLGFMNKNKEGCLYQSQLGKSKHTWTKFCKPNLSLGKRV